MTEETKYIYFFQFTEKIYIYFIIVPKCNLTRKYRQRVSC